MLSAELDHYLKVETEIGHLAEVESNYKRSLHEKKVAEQFSFESNDSEQLKELSLLDHEIEKYEELLYGKNKNIIENEYYSEYYEEEN